MTLLPSLNRRGVAGEIQSAELANSSLSMALEVDVIPTGCCLGLVASYCLMSWMKWYSACTQPVPLGSLEISYNTLSRSLTVSINFLTYASWTCVTVALFRVTKSGPDAATPLMLLADPKGKP